MSYSKAHYDADDCPWLFEGEIIGVIDGIPDTSSMRYLDLFDGYPFPRACIGTKEEVFNAFLKGECIVGDCVESRYKALYVGAKKRKNLLEEYFKKLPGGMYVINSTDWD